jgi:hypothetical protein
VALVVAVAAGVVLRFVAESPLWLDEALSVNIARLPLSDMFEALRRDGAPPLYYVVLRGWMAVFGTSDFAVRSLSGVFGVVALPLAWIAGRRRGGRPVASAALLLLATSPFAIRYATETRMYSVVIVGVLAGYLLVRAALLAPRVMTLTGVAVVAGLLALTHYWIFYLLGVAAVVLVVRWRRARDAAAGRVVLAILAGGIVFLPWAESFLYQLRHTGTPWGRPAGPVDAVITTLTDFGGGRPAEARALAVLLAVLAAVALTARPLGHFRVEVDMRTRPGVRAEAGLAAATLAVAVLAGWASGSAFATRYTAVVFPLAVLTAAWGPTQLGDRRVVAGVLAVAATLGLAGGVRNAVTDRTQAAEIASYINTRARSGDVVAYCPDQLGPAVHRVLDIDLRQMTFPTGRSPAIVDWADYARRNRTGDPSEFAQQVVAEAGSEAAIWLVWMPGYRTLGEKCEALSIALGEIRPASEIVILHDKELFERHNLTHLRAP